MIFLTKLLANKKILVWVGGFIGFLFMRNFVNSFFLRLFANTKDFESSAPVDAANIQRVLKDMSENEKHLFSVFWNNQTHYKDLVRFVDAQLKYASAFWLKNYSHNFKGRTFAQQIARGQNLPAKKPHSQILQERLKRLGI